MHKLVWPLIVGFILILAILAGNGYAKEVTKVPSPPSPKIEEIAPTGKGRWFMAADGHAVYCVGPVVRLGGMLGNMEPYATQCVGKAQTVRLHE